MSRHDPGTLTGADCHHSAGRIDKLIAIVKMQCNYTSRRIVARESRDLGADISQRMENRTLPLLRHSLTKYRKYAHQTFAKLSQSEIIQPPIHVACCSQEAPMTKLIVAARRSSRLRTLHLFGGAGMWLSLTALSMPAAADAEPCPANSDSRRLDFWLGDWSVTYPGASARSTSKVFLDLDQCLVVKNWTGGKGHSGKNLLAYSSDDRSWHGMFADNEGRVHSI